MLASRARRSDCWLKLTTGYCLAAIVTYVIAVGLALAHAPLRFPSSIVVQSLFQVPSCVLLFPFLRSPAASALFPRPLFGP